MHAGSQKGTHWTCVWWLTGLTAFLQVTPVSDRDFGRYNCTARNNIGAKYQEFILAQAGRTQCYSTPLPVPEDDLFIRNLLKHIINDGIRKKGVEPKISSGLS